jgi:hypothetical protein
MSQPGIGLQPKVGALGRSDADRLPWGIEKPINHRNAGVVNVVRV